MMIVNNAGVLGEVSQLTLRKLTTRTVHGFRNCRTSAAGALRIRSIDMGLGRAEPADFGAEALVSIVGVMSDKLVDIHGVMFFVPHGSDWSEQVSLFMRDPERFEAIHPRMIQPNTSYLYFARDVFVRARKEEADDEGTDPVCTE